MADPQPYTIAYSFSGFQSNSPHTPLPAPAVDNELEKISVSISGLVNAVMDVRRSDGALKNSIVTLDTLHPSLRTAALAPVQAWTPETNYGFGQVVTDDATLWSSNEAHTSGGTFGADAGKWTKIADLPAGAVGPAGTITIGEVVTGAPGSDAMVVNTGAPDAAILDITIPRGYLGETGPEAWAAPVAWQTAQDYVADAPASVVVQGGEAYVCLISHLSGTFSTDLTAERWIKVAAKGSDGAGTGDVVGPAFATVGGLVIFSDVGGKEIGDSEVAISTDDTLASNSDQLVPTEKAVKGYVDGQSAAKLDAAQTFTAQNTFGDTIKIDEVLERVTITGGAPSSTQNFDWSTQAFQYFTANNANNWTLNVRGDASTMLDNLMAVGESITIGVIVTNGSTAYRMTALNIDGNAVTPEWLGAPAPTAGTVNKRDVYSFTIIKTDSAAFVVEATFAGGN